MQSQKSRFRILLLAILVLNSSLFSFIGDDFDLKLNRNLTSHSDEEFRPATYNLNIPFHKGSLFSDRVEPVIICQEKRLRKISSVSMLNLDDQIVQFIVQHNSEIFRSLQLRTSFEFNCILQI